MKTINKIRVNNFKGMIKVTDKGETLIKKIQRILDENEPLWTTIGKGWVKTDVKGNQYVSVQLEKTINTYRRTHKISFITYKW